jgi:enoyl-CoA hydratase
MVFSFHFSKKVVYQQIRKGKNLDFKDCFSMELKIAQHMMTQSDFFEGVRALLIDKDKNPKVCAFYFIKLKQWNPSTLESVKQEEIDLYFK